MAAVEWNAICALGETVDTGGFMPKGFLTEEGPAPWLKDYGLEETENKSYMLRTEANVYASHGTLRFANDWSSRGTKLTAKLANMYDRPYENVSIYAPIPAEEIADWIRSHQIKILNVAGNRESVAIGIHDFVVAYMIDVLTELSSVPPTKIKVHEIV